MGCILVATQKFGFEVIPALLGTICGHRDRLSGAYERSVRPEVTPQVWKCVIEHKTLKNVWFSTSWATLFSLKCYLGPNKSVLCAFEHSGVVYWVVRCCENSIIDPQTIRTILAPNILEEVCFLQSVRAIRGKLLKISESLISDFPVNHKI